VKNPSGREPPASPARPPDGEASCQITDIMAGINAIGEKPLQRLEAEQLRRAYAAAVVRYLDLRRMSETENRPPQMGYRSIGD